MLGDRLMAGGWGWRAEGQEFHSQQDLMPRRSDLGAPLLALTSLTLPGAQRSGVSAFTTCTSTHDPWTQQQPPKAIPTVHLPSATQYSTSLPLSSHFHTISFLRYYFIIYF